MSVIEEQKAEIERLKKENAELQKQVSELTAKKDLSIANIEKELTHYLFMSCSYGALVCGKMSLSIAEEQAERFAPFVYGFIQQAIKDTAKEICDLILEHWEKKQFVECDWLRVEIAEKYGVEVEE